MAKATAVRDTPPPVTGVTLELSVEEAEYLHALVRSIGGRGPIRAVTDSIDIGLTEALGYKTNLCGPGGTTSNGFYVDGLEAVRVPLHLPF